MTGHIDMPRAAEVRPAESLGQLATVANTAAERGAEELRVAGEALAKARDLCPKGEWGKWLAKNWRYSPRYAYKLIGLARGGRRGPEDSILYLSEPVPVEATCDESSDWRFMNSGSESRRQNDIPLPSPTQRPAQTSAPKPPPPPTPSDPKPPWSPPVSGNGSGHKLTDAERVKLIEEHGPKPEPAGRVGDKLTGSALTTIASEARHAGSKFRECLDLLYAHFGHDAPHPREVVPILEAVARCEQECRRRETEERQ